MKCLKDIRDLNLLRPSSDTEGFEAFTASEDAKDAALRAWISNAAKVGFIVPKRLWDMLLYAKMSAASASQVKVAFAVCVYVCVFVCRALCVYLEQHNGVTEHARLYSYYISVHIYR